MTVKKITVAQLKQLLLHPKQEADLSDWEGVTELTIRMEGGSALLDAQVDSLLEILPDNSIDKLSFHGDIAEDLVAAIEKMVLHWSVKSLGLHVCIFSDSDLDRLSPRLLQSLEGLSLCGTQLTGKSVIPLVQKARELRELDLSFNDFYENSGKVLEEIIGHLQSSRIEYLGYRGNHLKDNLEEIGEAFKHYTTNLTRLDLARNWIGDANGWLAWLQVMLSQSQLEVLDLSTNRIVKEQIELLGQRTVASQVKTRIKLNDNMAIVLPSAPRPQYILPFMQHHLKEKYQWRGAELARDMKAVGVQFEQLPKLVAEGMTSFKSKRVAFMIGFKRQQSLQQADNASAAASAVSADDAAAPSDSAVISRGIRRQRGVLGGLTRALSKFRF